MKIIVRKFLLFYITMMLCASPLALQAATKKTSKHTATSSKHKVVKHKSKKFQAINYKSRSTKANYRLHANKAAIYADHYDGSTPPNLASAKALVINQKTGEVLYAKNTNLSTPIASVTKLMTAMVVLDAHQPMDELLHISDEDVDYLKGTGSKLRVGTVLTRGELLQLALMASENRAASALGRNYPGGFNAFIQAMNEKARSLGMKSSQFVDPTGLDSHNSSTAEDLVKMVNAAYHYPEIRQVSTSPSQEITLYGHRNPTNFVNTNALVRNGTWNIGLSKTGFINEAGRCLVMQAEISNQPMIIVLLDSYGKMTRIGDANRIRKWVENSGSKESNEYVSS